MHVEKVIVPFGFRKDVEEVPAYFSDGSPAYFAPGTASMKPMIEPFGEYSTKESYSAGVQEHFDATVMKCLEEKVCKVKPKIDCVFYWYDLDTIPNRKAVKLGSKIVTVRRLICFLGTFETRDDADAFINAFNQYELLNAPQLNSDS